MSQIHSSADVSPGAIIGAGTRVWNRVQVREEARVGRDCVLGKDVYIDRGVTLGDRVKIQNGTSLYTGVFVEDDVFIGPHCSFINDLRPRSFSSNWKVIPTFLRRGCSIGANATILCGVTLGEYSMVGAGAVITKDTLPYGLYIGNPARLKSFVGKSGGELLLLESCNGVFTYGCRKTGEKIRITIEPFHEHS